jgi:hypothetical protein
MINNLCLLEVIVPSFSFHIVRNINCPVQLVYIYFMFQCVQVFTLLAVIKERELGGGGGMGACGIPWQTEGHSFGNHLNQ